MIILKNIFHQSLENTWRIMDSSAQNLLTLYEFQPNTNTSVLDDPRIVFPANWLDKTSFTQICYIKKQVVYPLWNKQLAPEAWSLEDDMASLWECLSSGGKKVSLREVELINPQYKIDHHQL